MAIPFRHSAGFGKRIEYWIVGRMLKEGLDVYVPLVDEDAIDAVIRRPDGSFITVQIKARSKDVVDGNAALFAAISHELRNNYYFVFYSERLDLTWIMTSEEFINEADRNKTGKNKDKRSIWFNGKTKNKTTGISKEHCKPQFKKYLAKDFSRLTAYEGTFSAIRGIQRGIDGMKAETGKPFRTTFDKIRGRHKIARSKHVRRSARRALGEPESAAE